MNKLLGFVYLVTDSYSFKIGKTNGSIKSRIFGLQTGNANKITEVKKISTSDVNAVEWFLHRKYKRFRKSGEWFKFNDERLKSVISFFEKIINSQILQKKINTQYKNFRIQQGVISRKHRFKKANKKCY